MGLLRSCFARTQTWLQAGKYMSALAGELPSRNCWSVAEHVGDRTPDRSQRLLSRASWDEQAAMSQVRKYAAVGLDDAARRSRLARQPTPTTCAAAGRHRPPRTDEVHARSMPGPSPGGEISRATARTRSPPAAPPPPPPRREARNELKPATAFRIPASRTQFRHPRPAPVTDLDSDHAVPRPDRDSDRDRDRLPGSARAAVPDTITEELAHQQDGRIPARVTGAEHPAYERTGDPRPPARPASVTLSRTASHQGTRLPGRPRPREITRAGRTHGDARPTRRRTSSPNTPRAGHPHPIKRLRTPLPGPRPRPYVSVDPATQRSTARQGDTRRDREETARIAAFPQPAGRFRRWWQVLGSNQRRLSRRFYRPLLPVPIT